MTRLPRRVVLATTPLAMVAAMLSVPAVPAAAAPAPFVLDQRCVEDFRGDYPASPALEVGATASTLAVLLPQLIVDNTRTLSLETLWATLATPAETVGLIAVETEGGSVTLAMPAGILAAGDVATLHLETLMSTDCPSSQDLDYLFELAIDVDLTFTADPELHAAVDLREAEGTTSALTFDWPGDGEARAVHWGDTVVLQGEPGYFFGGPEGRAAGGAVYADLHSVPFFESVSIAAPTISADGSTATVTLPATRPTDEWEDDFNIWEYSALGIGQSGAGGAATAVADLRITPAPITGTTPRLSATPRAFRPLQALPGVWSPAPVTLTYQWLRDGTPIAGATAPTFRPRLRDVGHELSVAVTGAKPGVATLTLTSAPRRVRLL